MRKTMKVISWLVFLAFIALSSYANYLHGESMIAGGMLAVVPVGFAASVFILEGLISAGKASRWTFAGIGAVALASGVASYLGLYGMAIDAGIGRGQSVLMPLAFDGVVLVASMGIRGFSLTHVPPAVRVTRVKRERVPDRVSQPDVPAATRTVPDPDLSPVTEAKPSRVKWDKDKARTLLAEGRPRKEVAELCGVSRKTIDRFADSLSTEQVDG